MTLEWTGERFIPEVGAEISFEHRVRYLFAEKFVIGKRVLDAPCGEGYGSFDLSKTAESVVGIDISAKAVGHASKKYLKNNLKFVTTGMDNLQEFDDAEFDVITCFEGIEHVDRATQIKTLIEFRRVLKPDGILLISSPNKKIYSDLQNFKNEYHLAEYYYDEMKQDLLQHFKNVSFLGQLNLRSSMLLKDSSKQLEAELYPSSSDGESLQVDIKECMYFVAVCSNQTILVKSTVLVDLNKEMETEAFKNLNNTVTHLKEVNEELRVHASQLNDVLTSIYNSSSWKISAPLRSLKTLLKSNKN